jgi:type IV pilus assembly protein PilE
MAGAHIERTGMKNKDLRRAWCERTRASGFTLVELMVVISIIGILAAIAYPAYQQYVLRANRAEAKAILTETAQIMERYFTTNGTYVGGALSSAVSPKNATGSAVKYNISFTATPTATAFTVQAVPSGTQTSDSCGTLSLSYTGAQTPTTSGCW